MKVPYKDKMESGLVDFGKVYVIRIKEREDWSWSIFAICHGEMDREKVWYELRERWRNEPGLQINLEALSSEPSSVERAGGYYTYSEMDMA